MLKRDYKDKLDENAKIYIDEILSSVACLNNMIQYLLTHSRLNSEQDSFSKINMNNALATAKKQLIREIEENSTSITCDELPYVLADELRLIRVFQNLLANAIRYREKTAL